MVTNFATQRSSKMKEIVDTAIVVLFVFFMIFMVRGFMLQAKEKNRDKR